MSQQTVEYDNVPIHTGQPPAMPEATGFFQPSMPASEGLLAVDQARAVAEVQAALVIAASRPRNELRARDRLLQACQRVGLASGAIYKYNRGGTDIQGPSIRLAEAAARAWGNMNYGFLETARRDGLSECEAYAWDLETNTKAVRKFTVKHWRDTKKGGYALKDERDIYELMANMAQRRVRAAILEIIPGDIIEDAVEQCERTQKSHVGDLKEAIAKISEAFAGFGISRECIEKRLGHRIDAIQPAQIINLRKIWVSIRDGMSEPKDWFDIAVVSPQPPAPESGAGEQQAGEQPSPPAQGKVASPKKTPSAPASKSSQKPAETPPAQGLVPKMDTETDELFEAPSKGGDTRGTLPAGMMYPVYCLDKEKWVEETACEACNMLSGCPSWQQNKEGLGND